MLNTLRRIKATIAHKITSAQVKHYRHSFAQCGEDMIIDFVFTQMGITKPTYLDIGAHHPFYLSNTAYFYQKGCRGINIEPDRELVKQFYLHRKEDINLNCGVSNKTGEMSLFIMSNPTLNTFSVEEAERLMAEHDFQIVDRITTPVLPVSDIINEHNGGIFPDLLSLDVEGFDEEIIKSIDFAVNAPIVICLETISYSESGNGVKNIELINYLEAQGYMAYADTNINTIFVLKNKWQRKP